MTRIALLAALALAACSSRKSNDSPAASPGSAATNDPGGTVAQVRIGGDPDAPRHALALTIVAVHADQKPTAAAPGYSAGGKWTFLDLKTPGGAMFTMGYVVDRVLKSDVPITMYKVRVQAADPTQGGAVIGELAKALHTVAPPIPATDKPPARIPLELVASQLGGDMAKNPDGSFGGGGSWKATKWTSERAGHAAELFFNFSLVDNAAELSEKAGDYNADFVADLALALRDGGLEPNGK